MILGWLAVVCAVTVYQISLPLSPQMAAKLGDSVKAREAVAALRMTSKSITSPAFNFFISAIAKAGVSKWEGDRRGNGGRGIEGGMVVSRLDV